MIPTSRVCLRVCEEGILAYTLLCKAFPIHKCHSALNRQYYASIDTLWDSILWLFSSKAWAPWEDYAEIGMQPHKTETMTRCKLHSNNKLYHSTMVDNSLRRSLAAHVQSCNLRSNHNPNVWIKVLSHHQEYKTTGLDGTREQQATSYPS